MELYVKAYTFMLTYNLFTISLHKSINPYENFYFSFPIVALKLKSRINRINSWIRTLTFVLKIYPRFYPQRINFRRISDKFSQNLVFVH